MSRLKIGKSNLTKNLEKTFFVPIFYMVHSDSFGSIFEGGELLRNENLLGHQ